MATTHELTSFRMGFSKLSTTVNTPANTQTKLEVHTEACADPISPRVQLLPHRRFADGRGRVPDVIIRLQSGAPRIAMSSLTQRQLTKSAAKPFENLNSTMNQRPPGIRLGPFSDESKGLSSRCQTGDCRQHCSELTYSGQAAHAINNTEPVE